MVYENVLILLPRVNYFKKELNLQVTRYLNPTVLEFIFVITYE